MKKNISVVSFLLLTICCNSQNLNLKLLEQISNISFLNIDDFMLNGYGFEKLKDDEDGQKYYLKVYDNNIDNAIAISVIDSEDSVRNMLDLTVAKNYSLRKIKDDLVQNGYLYNGSNELGLTVYRKDDVFFLIANKPNDLGATQILMMYDQDP